MADLEDQLNGMRLKLLASEDLRGARQGSPQQPARLEETPLDQLTRLLMLQALQNPKAPPAMNRITNICNPVNRKPYHKQSYRNYRASRAREGPEPEVHDDLPVGPEMYTHKPTPQVFDYSHGATDDMVNDPTPSMPPAHSHATTVQEVNPVPDDQPDPDEDGDDICSTDLMMNVPPSPCEEMPRSHAPKAPSHFLAKGPSLKDPDKHPHNRH